MQLNMLSVEDARARILSRVTLLGTEEVGIVEALGRVLVNDAMSDIDIAPFANSAMDGFAVRAQDLAQASSDNPVDLEVIAHIGAGAVYDGPVEPGQTVRIMTGAPVPSACDAVVKVEDTAVVSGHGGVGSRICFTAPVDTGKNIRPAGQEAKAGQVVLHAGDTVDPFAVGLLASTGNATVTVHRRPRVGVIGLGSELVDITDVPGPGMIRNSNSPTLAAQAIQAGAVATIYPTVPDDEALVVETLRKAIAENDLVCSSGGASAGDYDYITKAANELGEVIFDRVNMRPGKSQTFAMIDGKPFIGLAGNPTAASMGFEMLIRPALRKMQGFTTFDRPVTRATILHDIRKKEPRREYLRGRVERAEDGTYTVDSFKNQSSALIGTMHSANCFIIMPEGPQEVHAGDTVSCLRIDLAEGAQ